MLVLLVRDVPPSVFGSIAVLSAVGTFSITVSDLGTSSYLLRERATAPLGGRVAAVILLSLYSVPFLIATPVIYFLVFELPGISLFTTVTVSLWVVFERLTETAVAIVIADSRQRFASMIVLCRRLLPLCVQLVLISAGVGAVLSYVAAMAIGCLLVFIVSIAILGPRLPSLRSRAFLSSALMDSRPFFWSALSSQARELEAPLVQLVNGATAGGIYSLGYRLSKPFSMLGVAMAQVLLPHVAREGSTAAAKIVRQISILTVFAVVAVLASFPLVDAVIRFVAGEEYMGAVMPTRALLIAIVFTAFTAPLGSVLQALGLERRVAINSVAFAVAGLLTVAAAAVTNGSLGAACAAAAAALLKFVVLLTITMRHL